MSKESGDSPSDAPLVGVSYSLAERGETSGWASWPRSTSRTLAGRMYPAVWKPGAMPSAVFSRNVIFGESFACPSSSLSSGVFLVRWAFRPNPPQAIMPTNSSSAAGARYTRY